MPTEERNRRGGSRYMAPSKELKSLIKTLYQILQCLHHQRNFNKGNAGPKSFRKKQADLKKFLRPAQANQQFREAYEAQVNTFMQGTLHTIKDHYKGRLESLRLELQLKNKSKLNQAIEVALRWGNRNFGNNLSTLTIEEFRTTVAAYSSHPMDNPANRPENQLPNQEPIREPDTSSTLETDAQGSPDTAPTENPPPEDTGATEGSADVTPTENPHPEGTLPQGSTSPPTRTAPSPPNSSSARANPPSAGVMSATSAPHLHPTSTPSRGTGSDRTPNTDPSPQGPQTQQDEP